MDSESRSVVSHPAYLLNGFRVWGLAVACHGVTLEISVPFLRMQIHFLGQYRCLFPLGFPMAYIFGEWRPVTILFGTRAGSGVFGNRFIGLGLSRWFVFAPFWPFGCLGSKRGPPMLSGISFVQSWVVCQKVPQERCF